jgi:hypothetical protein
MRGNLHLVVVLAGLCTGCAYDGSGYSQPNQIYGYAPGYTQPGEYQGYPPSYPPYDYAPYGSAPQYYQSAPSLGLGVGVFDGGGHHEHEREEWHEHHNHGGERPPGFERGEGHHNGVPAAINVPPATAHMPPPAFRPAPPPVAQRSPPPAAANARKTQP